jgi:competence protein ComGC
MSDKAEQKNANGGFTLVELVISFAILAIISVMITLIIRSSADTYSGISNDINLQYESQMAMSQLQDFVIDCNSAVAVTADSETLYVFNRIDDTHYEAFRFEKSASSDELYLSSKEIDGSFSKTDPSIFSFGSEELMSSYVKKFTAAVSSDVRSVSVTITYGIGDKTYIGRQTIALRNAVDSISGYAH